MEDLKHGAEYTLQNEKNVEVIGRPTVFKLSEMNAAQFNSMFFALNQDMAVEEKLYRSKIAELKDLDEAKRRLPEISERKERLGSILGSAMNNIGLKSVVNQVVQNTRASMSEEDRKKWHCHTQYNDEFRPISLHSDEGYYYPTLDLEPNVKS